MINLIHREKQPDLRGTGEVRISLLTTVKPPTRQDLEAALAAARPRRGKPGEAERVVAEALRKVREGT